MPPWHSGGGCGTPMGVGLGANPQRRAQRKAQTGGCIRPFGVRVHGEPGGGGTNPVPSKKKNNQKKLCKAFRGGVRLPLLVSVAAREDGGGIFPSPRIARSLNKGTGNAAQPSGGKHAADPPGLPRLLPAARPHPAPPGSQPPPPPLLSPPLFSPSSPGKSEVSC